MTSPLDEIIERLERIEMRIARLEAMRGAVSTQSESSTQLPAVQNRGESAPSDPVRTSEGTSVKPAETPAEIIASAMAPSPPGAPPSSSSAITVRLGPPTLRLAPIPPKDTGLEFPDLSQLDEKVEVRRPPVQKLSVTCALEEYPRISTRIQQLWGSPDCEPYLNTLVIDTRGNRKGFPPAVMEELLYLARLARALVILSVGGDLWDAYEQVGDRR